MLEDVNVRYAISLAVLFVIVIILIKCKKKPKKEYVIGSGGQKLIVEDEPVGVEIYHKVRSKHGPREIKASVFVQYLIDASNKIRKVRDLLRGLDNRKLNEKLTILEKTLRNYGINSRIYKDPMIEVCSISSTREVLANSLNDIKFSNDLNEENDMEMQNREILHTIIRYFEEMIKWAPINSHDGEWYDAVLVDRIMKEISVITGSFYKGIDEIAELTPLVPDSWGWKPSYKIPAQSSDPYRERLQLELDMHKNWAPIPDHDKMSRETPVWAKNATKARGNMRVRLSVLENVLDGGMAGMGGIDGKISSVGAGEDYLGEVQYDALRLKEQKETLDSMKRRRKKNISKHRSTHQVAASPNGCLSLCPKPGEMPHASIYNKLRKKSPTMFETGAVDREARRSL